MGQQQLLLVILVTIIVGIATVVAINIFGSAADQANRDAVRQDLISAAVQAQAIWARPSMMDGADRDFTGGATEEAAQAINAQDILRQLNIPGELLPNSDEPTSVENENGVYTVTVQSATSLEIIGTPSSGADVDEQRIHAVVCRDAQGNWQVGTEIGTAPTPCAG
jgi:hypothetical protein